MRREGARPIIFDVGAKSVSEVCRLPSCLRLVFGGEVVHDYCRIPYTRLRAEQRMAAVRPDKAIADQQVPSAPPQPRRLDPRDKGTRFPIRPFGYDSALYPI